MQYPGYNIFSKILMQVCVSLDIVYLIDIFCSMFYDILKKMCFIAYVFLFR